jgi:phosphatidylglycerophosphate synthase
LGPESSRHRVAGLEVTDRLVVSLWRAGIRQIAVVGSGSVELRRSEELGVPFVRIPSIAAAEERGPVLLAAGNVHAGVADLREVLSRSGRLSTRDGRRLPLGVVDSVRDDWRHRIEESAEVRARGPAGEITDEASARRVEREYWQSLTSRSDGWVDRRFNRPVGRWLSRALVGTQVTPNQVSVVAILMGLVSGALFSLGSWWSGVWGALLLQASAILDCVDGDLARAQYRESAWGKWLDLVGDQVVHLAVFLGLGLGLWRSGAGAPLAMLGIVAAVGVVLSFLVVLRAWMQPGRRGSGRIQRWIDATTNRDFSVLLIGFALGGVLDWFLWLAAIGSQLFWIIALAIQVLDRNGGIRDEETR